MIQELGGTSTALKQRKLVEIVHDLSSTLPSVASISSQNTEIAEEKNKRNDGGGWGGTRDR